MSNRATTATTTTTTATATTIVLIADRYTSKNDHFANQLSMRNRTAYTVLWHTCLCIYGTMIANFSLEIKLQKWERTKTMATNKTDGAKETGNQVMERREHKQNQTWRKKKWKYTLRLLVWFVFKLTYSILWSKNFAIQQTIERCAYVCIVLFRLLVVLDTHSDTMCTLYTHTCTE